LTSSKDAFDNLHKDGGSGTGEHDALEELEEAGEQNEVMLDELDRAAKKNAGGKWKVREKRVDR
jgi:hypothetical protein